MSATAPTPPAPPAAPPGPPADPNAVNIEVNGVPLKARKGQMLIEVTDQADIYVPRFCYHRKLTIAANCRMCLVEVEKAPKPLPACATPVAEGMKVFTRSKRAISAQKATMEFLLINHPLDCPICDQGGECELQDLAMGFGRGVSRYTEKKRIVKDKNLGPLVSTDMTRCIHCTRCVRFGQEIAGIQELGTTGRSEHMEIGTYIEKSVDHELSGNIIDLCPVGALNNKPYRVSARAWEMVAKPLVGAHDCAGTWMESNKYGYGSGFTNATAAPLRAALRMRCARMGTSIRRFEPMTSTPCCASRSAIDSPSHGAAGSAAWSRKSRCRSRWSMLSLPRCRVSRLKRYSSSSVALGEASVPSASPRFAASISTVAAIACCQPTSLQAPSFLTRGFVRRSST